MYAASRVESRAKSSNHILVEEISVKNRILYHPEGLDEQAVQPVQWHPEAPDARVLMMMMMLMLMVLLLLLMLLLVLFVLMMLTALSEVLVVLLQMLQMGYSSGME